MSGATAVGRYPHAVQFSGVVGGHADPDARTRAPVRRAGRRPSRTSSPREASMSRRCSAGRDVVVVHDLRPGVLGQHVGGGARRSRPGSRSIGRLASRGARRGAERGRSRPGPQFPANISETKPIDAALAVPPGCDGSRRRAPRWKGSLGRSERASRAHRPATQLTATSCRYAGDSLRAIRARRC